MRNFGSDGNRLLKPLGVSPAAEEAYLKLLLQDDHELENSVEHELEDFGLISPDTDGPKPISASKVIENALHAKYDEVKALKDSLVAFEAMETRTQDNYYHTSVSVYEMGVWYERIFTQACERIRYWDSEPHLGSELISPGYPSLFDRNIFVEAIYESESFENPEFTDSVLSCVRMGERVSIAAKLPFRMVISDDREVLIMWKNDSGIPIALLSNDPSLIAVMHKGFDHVWDRSIPFGLKENLSDVEIPENVKDIITLMTLGLTDEAIARRLNISSRTVARRIGALMSSLNINTRFQLGLKVQQNSLIDSSDLM
ncbi:LuxR C-terminal-related transcriptional regulator [Arcanobacterium phocae]|uniref:LuxR C-terminal-related transcriptional regulator n=1 Tax=Arcanobacterium phocae TaxID=131112 RepID=UPI001C0F0479|nr:LuxR C-terminal-related transcriptional regulator [Arcanobacterium phocae]